MIEMNEKTKSIVVLVLLAVLSLVANLPVVVYSQTFDLQTPEVPSDLPGVAIVYGVFNWEIDGLDFNLSTKEGLVYVAFSHAHVKYWIEGDYIEGDEMLDLIITVDGQVTDLVITLPGTNGSIGAFTLKMANYKTDGEFKLSLPIQVNSTSSVEPEEMGWVEVELKAPLWRVIGAWVDQLG